MNFVVNERGESIPAIGQAASLARISTQYPDSWPEFLAMVKLGGNVSVVEWFNQRGITDESIMRDWIRAALLAIRGGI